jgi:mRNA-degrading endonuclease RelE of RelBE toxin-antitoxin system
MTSRRAELVVMPAARRFIKKIKDRSLKTLFKTAIDDILKNPDIGKKKTGDLKGLHSLDIYYNKTNYELAYRVVEEDDTIVIVILAGTRENFYEELKRYLNS